MIIKEEELDKVRKDFNKKNKVEKICTLFVGCVIIPWAAGLLISSFFVNPLIMAGFVFYTAMALIPVGLIGCMAQSLRENKYCLYCKALDHWEDECPDRKNYEYRDQSPS